MYRCEKCGKIVPPGKRCKKIIAQTKVMNHPYRNGANATKVEDRWEYTDDIGGQGQQIVKELKVCEACE
jgi:hypothetical protein